MYVGNNFALFLPTPAIFFLHGICSTNALFAFILSHHARFSFSSPSTNHPFTFSSFSRKCVYKCVRVFRVAQCFIAVMYFSGAIAHVYEHKKCIAAQPETHP